MKNKLNIVSSVIFAFLMLSLSLSAILKPDSDFSESERRDLKKMPELSISTLSTGEFMKDFEEYTTDQFPFREEFRRVKALFSTKVLGKMENNKIYTSGEHISKIEYPENPEMIEYAINKFDTIYNRFLKDTDGKLYLSIIPDKNYFLAPEEGMLCLDYESFFEKFKTGLPYMEYIDVIPLLSSDDYYFTDSHWRQECIFDIATYLASRMGQDATSAYEVKSLDFPFYGVYQGQSALPASGDTLNYLTNDTLENAVVTYYDTGAPKKGELYDMKKASGKDAYEMFLSGSTPLVTLENPDAETDKELIIFRDSFGSALTPLLLEGYKKITAVDIRYMQSDFLGNFIDFGNQDILFIYSTTLLNNSTALR